MSALSAVLSTCIGCLKQFGEVSCTECTGQGNDFELIPEVKKIEILYRVILVVFCGVMAACSSKTLNILKKFLRFLEKRPLMVKFSNFCSKRFHRDTNRRVVFKYHEMFRRKIGEIMRCLTDKKIRLAFQLSLP